MLRDDLALLKMVWLSQAMARYDTLEEVAREAAAALPLLQREFTAEIASLKQKQVEGRPSSPPPRLPEGRDTPEQRLTR